MLGKRDTHAPFHSFGHVVQAVQTAALLEVGHAAIGIVYVPPHPRPPPRDGRVCFSLFVELTRSFVGPSRSGLGTTIAQVSSRILMVWYICQFYPSVRPHLSPHFAYPLTSSAGG
jgi:hypothetical protein